MELNEFNIIFKAKAIIEGQALTDFVAIFSNVQKMEPSEPLTWNLLLTVSLKK